MKITWKALITIFAVATVAVVGTSAYFSSRQQVTGNQVVTGNIDLTLNGAEDHESLVLDNFKPGEVRKYSWILRNAGSIEAQPSIIFSNVVNNDNDCTEPESILDSSCGDGDGELGSKLQIKADWKQDGGIYRNIKLKNKSGTTNLNAIDGITAGLGLMNTGGTDRIMPTLDADEEVEVRFTLTLPANVNNIVQSDSSQVDISFNLDQKV